MSTTVLVGKPVPEDADSKLAQAATVSAQNLVFHPKVFASVFVGAAGQFAGHEDEWRQINTRGRV